MGVEIEDATRVAGLIGTKVFADELISFKKLNELVCYKSIKVRHSLHSNHTLRRGEGLFVFSRCCFYAFSPLLTADFNDRSDYSNLLRAVRIAYVIKVNRVPSLLSLYS